MIDCGDKPSSLEPMAASAKGHMSNIIHRRNERIMKHWDGFGLCECEAPSKI